MNSKSIVSRLLLLAFGVGLFVGSFLVDSGAFAQTAKSSVGASQKRALEPIASFVNENTVLVVRFNLDEFNYDRFGETWQTIFNHAIVTAGFSQESIDSCNAEFAKTIEALKKDVEETFGKFKEQFQFSSAYFVMQSVKGEGACLILPAKDMSKEQVAKVVDYFKGVATNAVGSSVNAALYKKNFILASTIPLKDLGAYYKNFKPAPNRKIDAFLNENSDKVLAFYSNRLKIRPLLTPSKEQQKELKEKKQKELRAKLDKQKQRKGLDEQAQGVMERAVQEKVNEYFADPKNFDPFAKRPQCVRSAVEVLDGAFVGMQGYVDLAGLDVNLTMEFNTSVNSGKFVAALEDMIDEYVPLFFNTLQAGLDSMSEGDSVLMTGWWGDFTIPSGTAASIKRFRLAPLWREMVSGDLRRFLPKSYDTKVVFGGSAVDVAKSVGANTVFTAVLFSMLNEYRIEDEKEDEEEFQPFDDEAPTSDAQETPQAAEETPEETAPKADAATSNATPK